MILELRKISLENFYFFVCGAVIVLSILVLWVSFLIPGMNQWNKKFFVTLFAIFMLYLISAFFDLIVYGKPSLFFYEKITAFFCYFLLSIPIPMFTAFLLKICGENLKKNLILRTAISLLGIYFIFLLTAQFTEIFYYVTPENKFFQGSLYSLMFINLFSVIKRREKLPKKYFIAFIIFLIPLATTFSIYAFFYFEIMIFFGVVISTLSMFGIILYDQIEKYFEQQLEISKQQANILILQMRPHFIYNAMMSIYYLCAKNPEKAQEIILDFTTYLRKNFNAIASEEKILFSEELEHVRAYLAIEQVQFEENLLVEYEILQKNFKIPPLTLQPIVENSIKHGMDPEKCRCE